MRIKPSYTRVWYYLLSEQAATIKQMALDTGGRAESKIARSLIAAGLLDSGDEPGKS